MNALSFRATLAAVALGATSFCALAQDPAKLDASIYRCSLDNARVRLCEVVFKPGASIALHAHPDRVVYVINGGTLSVGDANGKTRDIAYTPGQSFWFTASSHSATNKGSTELKLLMVEVK